MKYFGEDREIPTLMSPEKRQALLEFCSDHLGETQEEKDTPTVGEIIKMVRASQKAREMSHDAI